jgi:type IV pilus assembly protein PilM
MGSIPKTTNFFKDRPTFGFDIGHGSLKVMQISSSKNGKPQMVGYGATNFNANAIQDGVIVDHEAIAKATLKLFKNDLIGDIATNRVVIAIPSYRTFTRSSSLPPLANKELKEAVELDSEQYIPLPLEDLYMDYSITQRTTEKTDLFVAAVPRSIVDSQIRLMQILGLETVGVQTTIDAASTLFSRDKQCDVPAVLIDFGSLSADITIYDKQTLVTGTVTGGGASFTDLIRDKLKVSQAEAQIIKTKYGLGPSRKQADIVAAIEPLLLQLVKEIRRMVRYYEERYGSKRTISQVITMGGGANMPGLSEYLTSGLRLATRTCDPWTYIDTHGLQAPSAADKPMFATVMGLSLVGPKELF